MIQTGKEFRSNPREREREMNNGKSQNAHAGDPRGRANKKKSYISAFSLLAENKLLGQINFHIPPFSFS